MKTPALIVLSLLLTLNGVARTITVSKSGKVKDLKTAVQIANNGDTILVKPGVYREGNIIIQKGIVIIGESYPELDGENKSPGPV